MDPAPSDIDIHNGALNKTDHFQYFRPPENVNHKCNQAQYERLRQRVSGGAVSYISVDSQVDIVQQYIISVQDDSRIDGNVVARARDVYCKYNIALLSHQIFNVVKNYFSGHLNG